MSAQIVECVPNFSEGRDLAKIKQITDAIEAVSGVTLLDVDPGADTNRTVVTFIGSPDAVAEGAFAAIATAASVLDMTTHTGSHPRMGATDVCPFVPVQGITLDECAEIARTVGRRAADELGMPVYLYEAAASTPERQNLAAVRRGEYEGLAAKLADPHWRPDFGPTTPHPRAGALIIGARPFLIAYNVTLNTRDKALATDIAFELREKGRVARTPNPSPIYSRGAILKYAEGAYPCGTCGFVGETFAAAAAHASDAHGYDLRHLLDLNDVPDAVVGQKVYKPGLFSHCKAIGWVVPEYDRAQISINLTDFTVTPPHLVLEAARRLATERGLVVTGSELVGLIPYEALADAGRYYLQTQGRTPGVPTSDLLATAVQSMGLSDVSPFDVATKVLGAPKTDAGPLVNLTVAGLADEVSRDTPAPGGGSIAALAGALAAALASMVAALTQGRGAASDVDAAMVEISVEAQSVKNQLIAAVDADTDAFTAYMDARRLPQATPEAKAARAAAMQDGLKVAIDVPMGTARASLRAMELADRVTREGNQASLTDGAVGVQLGFAGVRGAVWNALINLAQITDADYAAGVRAECDHLVARAREVLAANGDYADAKLA
ncbi:glutamate formimidoyltransferase [Propioniciclava tarda]|uniref:Formimidoyltransferase-cyclodeaminase n=1 Tax=Propioniciclava tarda TaxID=433330 RepID=A0A4Q9KK30_PROTD|nr:glutamate formimidoyltransferase [Propioniciclava tarda]TBT94803.1 glutamate formimidoyltransferase [Propioniciclava tarda]SMO62904.1 glutamate formiminotransferase / formiminotetrahydrofolate cyclodeaminase [Propioniciclava tarda]